MRNFSVHRNAVSRYMARSNSSKRSTLSSRNKYKLGTNSLKAYRLESQKLNDEINGYESDESTSSSVVSTALSKYSRNKATTYKASSSRFNTGYDAVSDSTDTFEELFKKEEFDSEKGLKAAEKFVEGYNDLLASVKASSSGTVSSKAVYFTDIAGIYTRTLEKAGIKADKNGELSVDKDKFSEADVKDLKSIFSKKSSFASYVTEQADNIKLAASLSADTYSGSTSKYGSSYANGYTSALSGSLFNRKL